MTLYSYVITRDYGFAPNPFHGYCTLATCKPVIRRVARIGDWIVGTGSAQYKRTGQLIVAMQVTERVTFDAYWADPRFRLKRPDLQASRMRAFGDNIYHHDDQGRWVQQDSHHSLPGGQVNSLNLLDDTQTDAVLISDTFWYFGRDAIPLPEVCLAGGLSAHRGHKVNFSAGVEQHLLEWLQGQPRGCLGRPERWPQTASLV